MNFLDFQHTFDSVPIIPSSEIGLHFPDYERNNLTRWQKKEYIHKIRNGFYRLNKPIQNQEELFVIAGKIYGPSYISLETALSCHGLIPEGVFSITSITHLKTQSFETPIGNFKYSHLKKELLFGNLLMASGSYHFMMADPVKALLDFLYLRHDLYEEGHIEELRLDFVSLKMFFTKYPISEYQKLFHSQALDKKLMIIKKMMP